jgi:hypothetical protein
VLREEQAVLRGSGVILDDRESQHRWLQMDEGRIMAVARTTACPDEIDPPFTCHLRA